MLLFTKNAALTSKFIDEDPIYAKYKELYLAFIKDVLKKTKDYSRFSCMFLSELIDDWTTDDKTNRAEYDLIKKKENDEWKQKWEFRAKERLRKQMEKEKKIKEELEKKMKEELEKMKAQLAEKDRQIEEYKSRVEEGVMKYDHGMMTIKLLKENILYK